MTGFILIHLFLLEYEHNYYDLYGLNIYSENSFI